MVILRPISTHPQHRTASTDRSVPAGAPSQAATLTPPSATYSSSARRDSAGPVTVPHQRAGFPTGQQPGCCGRHQRHAHEGYRELHDRHPTEPSDLARVDPGQGQVGDRDAEDRAQKREAACLVATACSR